MAKNKKRTNDNSGSTKVRNDGVNTLKNEVHTSPDSVSLHDEENIRTSNASNRSAAQNINSGHAIPNERREQLETKNADKTSLYAETNTQNDNFGANTQSRRGANEANAYDGYPPPSNVNDAKPLNVDSENGSNFDDREQDGVANRTDDVFSAKGYYDVGEESLKSSDLSKSDLAASAAVVGTVDATKNYLGNTDDKLDRDTDGSGDGSSQIKGENHEVGVGNAATINGRSGDNAHDIHTRQTEYVKGIEQDVKTHNANISSKDNTVVAVHQSGVAANGGHAIPNEQHERLETKNAEETSLYAETNAQDDNFGANTQSRRGENEANVHDGYSYPSNTNDAKPLNVDSENGSNFDDREQDGVANRTDDVFSAKGYYDVGEESLRSSDLSKSDLAVSTAVVGTVDVTEDYLGSTDDKLGRGASQSDVEVKGEDHGAGVGNAVAINGRSGDNAHDIHTRRTEYVKGIERDVKTHSTNISSKDSATVAAKEANEHQSGTVYNTSNIGGSKRNNKNAKSNQVTYDAEETSLYAETNAQDDNFGANTQSGRGVNEPNTHDGYPYPSSVNDAKPLSVDSENSSNFDDREQDGIVVAANGRSGDNAHDIHTRRTEYVKGIERDVKTHSTNISSKDSTTVAVREANEHQSGAVYNTSNIGGSKRNNKNAKSNQVTYDGDETAQEVLAGAASATAVAAVAAVNTVGNQVKRMRAVRAVRQAAEDVASPQSELNKLTEEESVKPVNKQSFTVTRVSTSKSSDASRAIDSLPHDVMTPKQIAKTKARNSLGRMALRNGGHVVLGTGKAVKVVAGSTATALGIVNDVQDMALGENGNYAEMSSKASKAFSDSEASAKGAAHTTAGAVSGTYHGYKGTKKFVKNIKKEIYHKGGVVRVYDRTKRRKQILRVMKYQKAQKTFKVVKAPVGVVGKGFSAQKGAVEKVMDYSSALQRFAVSDKSANETSVSLLESGETTLAPKAITAGKSAVKGTYKMAKSAANTKTNIRVAKKTIKTSKSQIKRAKESSKAAVKGVKEAYKAGERGRELAKRAYQAAKAVGSAAVSTAKAAMKALRESSKMALSIISIGGCTLLLIVLIVSLVLIAIESVTEVFSNETEETATTTETLASSIDRLKTDYEAYLSEREEILTTNLAYDEVEIVRENQVPPQWKEALAVYSASVFGDDALSANEMTEERYETLLNVFKDMNSYRAKYSYTYTIGIGEGLSVADEMEAWGFSSEQKFQAVIYAVNFSTILLEDGGREEIEEIVSISLDRIDAEYEEYKETRETALQGAHGNASFVFEDDMTSDSYAAYVSLALSIYAVLTYGNDALYPDLTEDEKYELINQLYTEMCPIEITYKKVTVTFSTKVGRTVSEESSRLALTDEQKELLEEYLDDSFDDIWEELVEGTGWV